MSTLSNFAAFQIGWFSCVLGAANHRPWLGTTVSAGLIAWHLTRVAAPRSELTLVLLSGLIGLVLDSTLVGLGLIRYASGAVIEGLAPHWIVAMWMIFATTLNVAFRWLKRRWLLAAALGAIAGPLAYFGGASLDAAEFIGNTTMALSAIAVVWAGGMPLLLWLSDRYDGMASAATDD
jgi:hypothetical protein